MKKRIAVLPGDGVGPEIIDQAVKVLDAIGERFNHQFEYCYADAGAEAARIYGDFFPETTISTCLQAHAVLAGPFASNSFTYSPEVLKYINSLVGQFVHYLPLRYYTSTYHLSTVRETRLRDQDHVILNGYDLHLENPENVDRFCRYIFNIASEREGSVTFVQTGSIKNQPEKWWNSINRVDKKFADLKVSFVSSEKIAHRILHNQLQDDVFVTLDETGRLLQSLANRHYGTAGLLPKILVGQKQSIFQTTQGAQSEQADEDTANPFAMLHATALMLDYLDLHKEARLVEKVVQFILEKEIGTADLSPTFEYHCSQIGDIAAHMIGEGNSLCLKRDRIRARMSTII